MSKADERTRPWQPVNFADLQVNAAELSAPAEGESALGDDAGATQVSEKGPPERAATVLTLNEAQQQELEQLRQQAREQGYEDGLAKGQVDGQAQGLLTGQEQGRRDVDAELELQKQAVALQLGQLVNNFLLALAELEKTVGAKLVAIALAAAQKVIGEVSQINPEQVLLQVKNLIAQEPLFNGQVELCLNPDDLPVIEAQLTEIVARYHWRVVADPQIASGGCKIVSSEGELDATLQTQWQNLLTVALKSEG